MGEQSVYLQQNRFLQITTTLTDSDLLLAEVEGTDVISAPFVYHIQFYTKEDDSKILGLLGQPATLLLCRGAETPGRPVNGIFRKLTGPSHSGHVYKSWRAELVPQLAFLAYTSDCRIFQNETVVDIVTKVLQLNNIQKFQFRNLMGTYPQLDYCVQYRESALNFISRLMEHVGLFYWFEHTQDGHTLIIADSKQAARSVSPDALAMTNQGRDSPILMLEADYSFRPGTWTLKDYDFVNPDSKLQSSKPTVITQAPMASYEVFEFPGSHGDSDMGDMLARVRIEQEESQFNRMRGASTLAAFNPGYQVTIAVPDGHAGHTDTKLLLVEVYHHASDLTQIIPDGGAPRYGNEFSSVPMTYNFRPERLASKPFVQGPQTARVTGPAGQTIYTDQHGRVKVRFHWDRNPDGNADDSSSCWLRVSQLWSSGTGGGLQIPRVGEEVIVDFLEGDPDRPIITGRVYNGNNMNPYGTPGNATQFGFRTQSVAAGGGAASAGFNELRFEDAAGSEHVYVQAQKDYIRYVINDENDTIGANVTRQVTGNVTHTTSGSETKTVVQDETRTVQGDYSKSVTGDYTKAVTGNVTHTHDANVTVNTTGSHAETVATSHQLTTPAATWSITDWLKNVLGSDVSISPLSQSLTGVNLQLYGSSVQTFATNQVFNALNQTFSGLNNTINGVDASTNGLDTDDTVTKLENVATKIKTVAMDIGNHVMKMIN